MQKNEEKEDPKAELVMTPCYSLNGILYVPHYKKQTYVRPGYGRTHLEEYSWLALLSLGAKKIMTPLWDRQWMKEEFKDGK